MTDWREGVARIAATEEDENTVLHELSAFALCPHPGPVVIIVHPGDASDEPGIDESLEAMQITLAQRRGDSAIIVLHRFSSVYMDPEHDYAVGERACCTDWFDAVAEICDRPDTVQFYGDGLEEFSDRIAPALVQASEVLVTGLWGDAEDGCAATVARHLAARGLPARLDQASPRAWERDGPSPF